MRLHASRSGLYDDTSWEHHWRSAGGVSLAVARFGETYRLGIPGLAVFDLADEARSIDCRPEGPIPPATLQHLIVDQVLPRALALRGRLVLHAGCIVTGAGAIAFLGDSGAGKSTLCAAFSRAGLPILGDDGIVVRLGPGGAFDAMATYPGLRLRPGPLEELLAGSPSTAMAHDSDKRRVGRDAREVAFAEGPVPLAGFYLLTDSGPSGGVRLSNIRGTVGFEALLRSLFQLHLRDRDRAQALFGRLGDLVEAVPVRELSYPRSFGALSAVIRAVTEDLRVPTSP